MKFFAALFALFAAAGVLAAGGATSQPRASLATVYSSCVNDKQAALTFDDGPWQWLNDISKFLVAAGGKGTFCFNGKNWACIYDPDARDRVKYAYDNGHQVVSHTWSHPDLNTLSSDQIRDEMSKIDQALERITGASPAFMRPPYGNYNNLVLEVAKQRNQSVIMWDLDTGDSVGASVEDSKKVYSDAVAKNPRNILALNHETYSGTAETVVPYAIKLLQSNGYQLVTVAECLGGLAPYQRTGAPQPPDSTWTC
ncbi:carbohydrate esterase family 4 protein [Hydnum rufescens UP504]|uniref:Carbohydrate esterase family 4 protein n=1 Tax=Hydnum rufescens UP504 TaxID=1448309 RepID=A0A9P6E044_9AGAM|nr:carbohydrate esterase family 4 protein [Hydnum rufescens UP504]